MQHFVFLECKGSVDIKVSSVEGGVLLRSEKPFLCETEGRKIIVRSKSESSTGSTMIMSGGDVTISGPTVTGIGSIMAGGNVTISDCSSTTYRTSPQGCTTMMQSTTRDGRTQRVVIVDGVDVSNEVRQADDCKREYTLFGDVTLSKISVSDSSKCQVLDHALLNTNCVGLDASDSAVLCLPPCEIGKMNIFTSSSAIISGHVTVRRLLVRSSGTGGVSDFYATEYAELKADGCASITVRVSTQANVDRSASGCAKIVVLK